MSASDSSRSPLPSCSSHISIDTSFLVNDKWKIESKIGSGASGVVYIAKDLESDETVAVKLEHRNEGLLRNEREIYEHLGCFRESCRAFGLPYIHFYGMYGPDHIALVMDCLGPSLEADLESNQKMDQETFSKIAMKALDILQYVHRQGVVHADVWAGNFLRGRNDADALYLVDFGIADNCRRSRRFEKLCILDLQDLGKTLYELRTGKEYKDIQFSSGVAPELDRYFEMLELDQQRNSADHISLRRMFEDFLLEHRRTSGSQS